MPPPPVADPVAAYSEGNLPDCYGGYHRSGPWLKIDTVTLLEEKDVLTVRERTGDWRKPADGRSPGGVLFVDGRVINGQGFTESAYYVLEKYSDEKFCVSYKLMGAVPFH